MGLSKCFEVFECYSLLVTTFKEKRFCYYLEFCNEKIFTRLNKPLAS